LASETSLANLPCAIWAFAGGGASVAAARPPQARHREVRLWPSSSKRAPMTHFVLDPRLATDTIPIGDLALCAVLLMNDARFPWFILVPRRPDLRELTDLSDEDGAALIHEIRIATRVMMALAQPDKVNIGALGNVVAQLHVHVVGRFRSDPAWPGPVWGYGRSTPYRDHAGAVLVERAAGLFTAA
jgi:diadenosine tetraphosphate (Ap4A) HIT family hydrolase